MSLTHPHARTWYKRLTVAQVNAGYIAVPAHPGRTYTVVDGWARAYGGAAGSTTSVDVTDGTTVAIAFGVTGLTENAVLRAGATNTTATNVGTASATGAALSIANTGTAVDTATHIDVFIAYKVTAPVT